MLSLLFLGVPAAVYLSLCLLARGKPAAIGIAVAAGAAAVVWFTAPEGFDGAYQGLLAMVVGFAVAGAAAVQAVRLVLPADAPPLAWPGLVGLVLLAGLAGLKTFLGA